MDLQFAIEETLENLCFHYLLNQTSKSKIVILNSILLQASANDLFNLFSICKNIVEETCVESSNSTSSKQCLKNMAELLSRFVKKSSMAIPATPPDVIGEIVNYCTERVFCAVSGNEFIALIDSLAQKKGIAGSIGNSLEGMLMNNKMHLSSYRQSTRNQLYSLLIRIMSEKQPAELTQSYLQRVIRNIEDEKDPRNMPNVLQIYHLLINKSAQSAIAPLKNKLFDCLEMYYPIDFEGDPSKHNIDLMCISGLLDQCLVHPMFSCQLQALLKIKMAASPISKYIPTFLLTDKKQQDMLFWLNLLLKTAEKEYLEEDYEGAQFSLADLIVELLNRIVKQPMTIAVHHTVTKWLSCLLVDKIFNQEDNSKYVGPIIAIMQKVLSKCNQIARHLVCTFTVHGFINNTKSPGQPIYKMGMLVPILEQPIDSQLAGLLILSLTHIFHQSEEPQPKLLVLKLFMLLSSSNKSLVNQSNILPSCYKAIEENEYDPSIIKAFLDFIIEVHWQDPKLIATLPKIANPSARAYGVMALALKVELGKQLKIVWQQLPKECFAILKTLKIAAVVRICSMLNEEILGMKNLIDLEEQMKKKIVALTDSDKKGLLDKMNNPILMFLLRTIWKSHLHEHLLQNIIKDSIMTSFQSSPTEIICKCAAFYNKAISAYNLKNQIELNSIIINPSYMQEAKSLLPLNEKIQFDRSQKYQPTLIHYFWMSSKNVSVDLIERLPASILSKEVDRILPTVMQEGDIEILEKIFKAIPQQIVALQILPFIQHFLDNVNEQTEVKKVVAANSIVAECIIRAKEQLEIHGTLIMLKGKLLVALEERSLQHRKRRVRQSSRKVFSELNMLK